MITGLYFIPDWLYFTLLHGYMITVLYFIPDWLYFALLHAYMITVLYIIPDWLYFVLLHGYMITVLYFIPDWLYFALLHGYMITVLYFIPDWLYFALLHGYMITVLYIIPDWLYFALLCGYIYDKCPKISNSLFHTFLPKCCYFMHLFHKMLDWMANSALPYHLAPWAVVWSGFTLLDMPFCPTNGKALYMITRYETKIHIAPDKENFQKTKVITAVLSTH